MALEDKIVQKAQAGVKDLNRFRDQRYMRAGLALPGTFSTQRSAGAPAALAYAKQFAGVQKTAPTDPMEVIGVKKDILDSMSAFMKARDDSKATLVDKLSAFNKANDKIYDLLGKYMTGNASARSAVSSARIRAQQAMSEKMMDISMAQWEARVYGGFGGDDRGAGQKAYRTTINDALASWTDNSPPDEAFAKIGGLILDPTLSPIEARVMVGALRSGLAMRGVSLEEFVNMSGNNQMGGVILATANDPEFLAIAADIDKQLIDEAGQINAASLESIELEGAGVSAPELVRAYKEFEKAFGMDASQLPTMGDTVEQALKMLKPAGDEPNQLALYEELLKEMDNPNLQPATTMYEARQRLFADPSFIAVKEELGLKTDQATLKYLRQGLGKRRRQERMADATTMRNLRMGPSSKDEGDETSARAASGDIGEAGDIGSASAPAGRIEPEDDFELPKSTIDRTTAASQGAKDAVELAEKEKSAQTSITTEGAQAAISEQAASAPAAPTIDEIGGAPMFGMRINEDPATGEPDPDNVEIFLWDPEQQAWLDEHPLLDVAIAEFGNLPEEDQDVALRGLIQNYESKEASGEAAVKGKMAGSTFNMSTGKWDAKPTPKPVVTMAEEPDPGDFEVPDRPEAAKKGPLFKDGIRLPSSGMVQQGMKNLIFGLPELARQGEGALARGVHSLTDPEQTAIRKLLRERKKKAGAAPIDEPE